MIYVSYGSSCMSHGKYYLLVAQARRGSLTVTADHCRIFEFSLSLPPLSLSYRCYEVNNLLRWALARARVNIDRAGIETTAPFAAQYNKFNREGSVRKYLY